MTTVPELVEPSAQFRDSYRGFVAELVASGEKLVPFVLAFEHGDFDAFLSKLADCSRGDGLPSGFVPHSTYWLIHGGTEVVGVSNIRHRLTEALHREGGNIGYGIRPTARRSGFGTTILRHALARAAQLGLRRVLLTCGKTNVGSIEVIRRNGGLLESEEFLPDRGEIVQRYWLQANVAA
jgi:predicted acetyltransferase